ncbi:MAG: cytochrome c, partial [Thermoleophilaceae bacterium]|nr:cytochrome c [Thermoleophilaceae bacterium]
TVPKSNHIKSFAVSVLLVLTVALFAFVLGGCGESKNSTYPAASSYDEPTGAAGAKEAAAADAQAKAAEAKAQAEQAAADKKKEVAAKPAVDGKALFTSSGCSGCHTLAAAGSDGSAGPNLDDLKPTAAEVSAQVKNGGGGMPAFADLSPQENAAISKFVADSAGK